MLVSKIRMGKTIVARDAEDDTIILGEFAFVVREIRRLQGAVGRAVARLEEQHGVLVTAQRTKIE